MGATKSSILHLFRFADQADRWLLLLGSAGSIGDGLMNPLTMLVLSGTINTYGTAGSSLPNHQANKYALRLVFVALFVGTAAFLEGLCWTRTAERQTSKMRRKYLQAVLRQDASFFDIGSGTTATYEVVTSISSDADMIQDVLGEKMPNALANITTFISSLVVALVLSWRLTAIALPFSLFFILPGVIYGKRLMEVEMQMREAYGIAGGIAEQAISSIRTVVSYVGERQTIDKFNEALERSTELGIKQGLMKGVVVGTMGMVFALWAFQSWAISVLVTERGEEGGHLFIAGICVILGGLAIMSALPNVRYFSEALIAASRIYEMIDRLPSMTSKDATGTIKKYKSGEIEFQNVEFTYPSRPDSPVLCGLNLRVAAGQTIGLAGSSGSGKSTVISLLQRFYSPNNGRILLDGYDIRNLQLKWFRSQIGLVSQEPVLFATSIKENILFGKAKASMDQIVRAAKTANAHDFIIQLPSGYDTHVGHFGFQMSGGQKQRIAIARALVRDPKILVLDEATSALDAQSERLVQDALDQASIGRTTIIVAHRLTTLRKADFTVVLQEGKVVESGTHDQLMQMNGGEGGIYARMIELQKTEDRREGPLVRSNGIPSMTSGGNSLCSSKYSTPRTSRYGTPTQSPFRQYSPTDQEQGIFRPSIPSQWSIIKMNKPEWKRGLLGCIGAVTYGAVQPIHSYCLGSTLYVYFLQDNDLIKSKTRFYCFIFLSLAFVTFITNVIQHYNFAIMGERLTKRVREQMLEKVLSFEIGWFDLEDNSSASICARLATEANKVRSLVGDRLSLLLQASTAASLAFILGFLISWRLAAVMIAMQPLVISSFYLRKVLLTSMSKKAKRSQIKCSQLASEAVVNQRTIAAFSAQKRMLRLFELAQEEPRKENIKQSWISGLCLFICLTVVTDSIAVAFWYGGKLIAEGLLTQRHLFQAFFVLMSTGKVIADAGSMTSDLAKGADAVRSVLEILNRKSKIEPDYPENIKKVSRIKAHIELKNVLFCYPTRPEEIIFNGMNLKIDAGTTMALVGQSGSGKSTVIALIARFYDPMKGSVEIGGKNIKDYNLRHLRLHIALVSQEPTLFAGSIRDNIVYGKDNAAETEITRAATMANAHEFISSMQNGYETLCGERGVQLSGGQRQRIALARAILKNPAILLLDEATSALDSLSENLIQEALDKMMIGRTCVVVAHRLSTIRKSDSIALIKGGKVVEQGSHSELLSVGRGGSYFKLVRLQQRKSP